jgi:hypothetical protein
MTGTPYNISGYKGKQVRDIMEGIFEENKECGLLSNIP